MNERIKELLTSKLKEWGADSDDNFSEEIQKFAELIVRECIDVLEIPGAMKMDTTGISQYNEGWINGRKLGVEHLKEHFGVEE
jgi:hypothetical protein